MSNFAPATVSSCSGEFNVTLSNLEPGHKYAYQAYAKVYGTGDYADEYQVFYASAPDFFTMPEPGSEPAVDAPWLELTSAKKGDQYLIRTYYAGERNYTHFFDTSMKTSLWTAYPLNSSHMGSLKRPSSWHYSPDIPQEYQINVTSGSYKSGYSRGHLLPNGSRNGNSTMQKQAFYVTNQVPQIQNTFNGSIWNNLENAVQGVAQKEEVYVVTGVAFNKEGETKSLNYATDDAGKQVAVPNYFYKVVLKVKTEGSKISDASTIGFWFEHKGYAKGDSYINYSVSVDQIEEWTGFDFFVNLPDDIENTAESASITWDQFSSF